MKELDPNWRTKRPNDYRIVGDTAVLTLSTGQETVVDLADLSLTLKYRWHPAYNPCTHSFYARTHMRLRDGRWTTGDLQRLLLSPADGLVVDHVNHDTLDNRRQNLRAVTQAVNVAHRRGARHGSATGEWAITQIANRYGDHVNTYYHCRCHVGQTQCGGHCVSRLFPHTAEGLAAAIAFRNEHWRTQHPGLRMDQLDQATEGAAKEAA